MVFLFRIKNFYKSVVLILLFSLISVSCSDYGLGEFQESGKSEYSLTTILDDYPALHNLVYSLSLNDISKSSVALIYEDEETYNQTKDDIKHLLMDRKRPAQNAIKLLKPIIDRVVNQDSYDKYTDESQYADNFYKFGDLIRDYDFSIREDLLNILVLTNRYSEEKISPDEHRDMLQRSIDDLNDPVTKDIIIKSLELTIEGLSKAYIQADTPMWVNTDTNELITDTNTLDDITNKKNIGLGNSVQGMNSLILGMIDLSKDLDIRNALKDIIFEAGDLTTTTIRGKEPYEVIRNMMLEERSYFTVGGDKYSSNTTFSHGETYNDIYGRDDNDVYSNSELRNVAQFSHALGLGMFLRSDREESLISSVDPAKKLNDDYIEDDTKQKHYFLELLGKNLNNIGFDPETARIEESIYDLIRFDTFGRDRLNYNASSTGGANDPWPVSYLEQFLFLSAMSQNAGWFDGGSTGEITSSPEPDDQSIDHGHGKFAGGITMNDSLFAMGGELAVNIEFLGIDIEVGTYSLAFNNNRESIYRSSKTRFSNANRSNFKMGYDQNNLAQRFMSGAGPGDIGIPTGGNQDGGSIGYNQYEPYSGDGVGDTNTSRFLLYWMSRICWNGEGPYYHRPSSPPLISFEHDGETDTWEVYYRPNGQVYAFKNLRTGGYLYPADGDDPEDPGTTDDPSVVINSGNGPNGEYSKINGRKQRHNRYKAVWYSDYYMIQLFVDPLIGSNLEKTVVPNGDSGLTQNSLGGRFKFEEMISEGDPDRACGSQIEAIYRNYQWLVAEKKMAIVVPMFLDLDLVIHEQAAVYQIMEGNGIAGLTGARKFKGNHVWAYQNNSNKNSSIPGDHRMRILFEALDSDGNVGLTGVGTVWDSLANGTSQPAIITHNVSGVYRFAFPRIAKDANNIGIIGSKDFEAKESDPIWNKRNGLLPIIMASLGTIMDYQNRNFSIKANRDQTIMRMKKFTEALMGNILPRFYYRKNGFANKTWTPRIIGGTNDHHNNAWKRSSEGSTSPDGSAWLGWAQRTYFQPMAMRTPLNLLFDSDPTDAAGFCDGMLPMVTEYDVTQPRGDNNKPKTRLVTKALNLLLKISDDKYDDPKSVEEYVDEASSKGLDFDDTYADWGVRRKLFYGLEQQASLTKATKGPILALFDQTTADAGSDGIVGTEDDDQIPNYMTFENWMFAEGENPTTLDGYTSYTDYSKVRNEDIILNPSLDLKVRALIDNIAKNESDEWINFIRGQKAAAAMMSSNGEHKGDYYVLDKLIGIVFDKILAQDESPTKDHVAGFIHTIGMVFSKWNGDPDEDEATNDGTWEVQSDEFVELVTVVLHRMNEITIGEYPAITNSDDKKFAQSMKLAWSQKAATLNLEHEDGMIRYILNTIDLDKKFSTGDLFRDINRFINEKYNLLTDYDTVFWPDVVQLMNDSAESVVAAKYNFDPLAFFGDDFQYNGGIKSYWDQ